MNDPRHSEDVELEDDPLGSIVPEPTAGFDGALFEPSLQGAKQERPSTYGRVPWRVDNLFFVGFFGGPLAAGAIGWINAGRLLVPRRRRMLIAAIVVSSVTAWAVLLYLNLLPFGRARALNIAFGVPTGLLVTHVQQREANVYSGHPQSLWWTGLAAVIAGIVATAILVGAGAPAP